MPYTRRHPDQQEHDTASLDDAEHDDVIDLRGHSAQPDVPPDPDGDQTDAPDEELRAAATQGLKWLDIVRAAQPEDDAAETSSDDDDFVHRMVRRDDGGQRPMPVAIPLEVRHDRTALDSEPDAPEPDVPEPVVPELEVPEPSDAQRAERPEPSQVHDTTRVHDTTQVHDTSRVHDASRVHDREGTGVTYDTSRRHDPAARHDTSQVHDTSRVHDTTRVHGTGRRPGRPIRHADARRPAAAQDTPAIEERRFEPARILTAPVTVPPPPPTAPVTVSPPPPTLEPPALEPSPVQPLVGESSVTPHEDVPSPMTSHQSPRNASVARGVALIVAGLAVLVLVAALAWWGPFDQRQSSGRSSTTTQERDVTTADDLAVRRESGRQLVTDTRVRLTPRAWATLSHGDVHARLIGLLERFVERHTIDVAAFPRTPAERAAGAPARSMRVTAIDGQLVDDATGTAGAMRAALLSQPGEIAPDSVTLRRDPPPAVLLVRVRPPSTVP
ncbi:MAG TPA: hypothetical protein VF423_13795 [Actinomycetes bacterium]